MRVGIDMRRGTGSGVWRVSQTIVKVLERLGHDLVLFGSRTDMPPVMGTFISCSFGYHTNDDYFRLPEILATEEIDVFLAPQYYVAPFSTCRTIRYIHDLWPLLYPQWLPSTSDFIRRYGTSALVDSIALANRIIPSELGVCGSDPLRPWVELLLAHDKDALAQYHIAMFALTIKRATIIVCPSNNTYGELATLFPEALTKTVVIPNIVEDHFFSNSPPGGRENIILHVSNWEPRKNIETLLSAFQLFCERGASALLFLVGNPGSSNYTDNILQRIALHPYRSSILQLGLISDDDLARLYKRAKVYVCSSVYEGFGIPIMEAMASGMSVVAAKAGASSSICGNAALFFDPLEPDDLANSLLRVWTDDSMSCEMTSLGARQVASYSSDRVAPLYASLMSSVMVSNASQ